MYVMSFVPDDMQAPLLMLIIHLRLLHECLTLSKVCDDTELLIRLKRIKHLDDILMPEASQNLNLLS